MERPIKQVNESCGMFMIIGSYKSQSVHSSIEMTFSNRLCSWFRPGHRTIIGIGWFGRKTAGFGLVSNKCGWFQFGQKMAGFGGFYGLSHAN